MVRRLAPAPARVSAARSTCGAGHPLATVVQAAAWLATEAQEDRAQVLLEVPIHALLCLLYSWLTG